MVEKKKRTKKKPPEDPDFDGWLLLWGTIGADEIVIPNWGASIRSIYLHSFTTSNNLILNVWQNLYKSINRINSGIERIGAMNSEQIDEDLKNLYIALKIMKLKF